MKIVKLYENSVLPTKAHKEDAGFDLYAHLEPNTVLQINPHETIKVGTGIAVSVPIGSFGMIAPRSGLSTKKGLRPANSPGTIDSLYTGEVIVALHNDTNEPQYINHEDRIAQLIIVPYWNVELEVVQSLEETERGDKGFGSSGA